MVEPRLSGVAIKPAGDFAEIHRSTSRKYRCNSLFTGAETDEHSTLLTPPQLTAPIVIQSPPPISPPQTAIQSDFESER